MTLDLIRLLQLGLPIIKGKKSSLPHKNFSSSYRFLVVFFLFFSILQSKSQVTNLYTQNFGTGTSFPTGWSAAGSNTWTISTSNSSTPAPPFSGGSNLAAGSSTSSRTVTFTNNLSTVGFNAITVRWAARKTMVKTLTFEWSPNNSNWYSQAFTDVSSNSTWAWVNGGTRISLPVGAAGVTNLSFRWTFDTDGSGGAYRIDDFTVEGCMLPSQPSAIAGSTNPCLGSSQTYSVIDVSGVTYTWSFPAGWTQTGGGTTNSVTVIVGNTSGTISVTPSNVCGAGTPSTVAVNVNSVPAQPSVITGNTGPCQGSSQTYSVTNVAGVTYNWSFPAGWVQTGGGTGNSVTATTGATPGNVTVVPSNACGDGASRSLAVTPVSGVPASPGTITGSTSPCLGTTLTYSVANVAGVTYTWSTPAGWTINAGQGTNSISVTAGANSGNVTVTPSNVCGNGTASNLAVSVLTIPSQPGTISGSATPCTGSSVTYSVANVSGVTYTWSFPADWVITSGQGTNSVLVTTGSMNGTVQVVPSNACGSGTPQTLAVTVISIPSQPSSISGNSIVCKLSNQTYSVTNVPGTTYTWSVPSGWTITAGQGTHTITTTVGVNSGNITVTPSNACGSGIPQILAVTVQLSVPSQPSVITGNPAPCQGASLTYSVVNVPGVNYSWTVPSGWTITAGQGTNSITVTVGASPGNVTVSPSNTCGGGVSRSLAVAPQPAVPSQPSQISGNDTVCAGTSQTYSVTGIANVTYTWTVPADWTIASGQGTSTLLVTVGNTSGTVSVTPSNSCGNGTLVSLVVLVQISAPATPGPVTGNANPCQGSNQTYSVPNVAGVIYTWSIPADWTFSSGQGSNSINVVVGSLSGNLQVIPSNACGSGPSVSLAITVILLPTAPGAIQGNTSVCQGSDQTYVVGSTPGLTYTWNFPSGWTIISGQGNDTIQVQVGVTSGNITVTPSNSCGNGTPVVKLIQVNPLPAAYTGNNATICEGASIQIGGPAVPGNTYSWTSVPAGFTSNLANPVVTPASTTSYILIETNTATGCSNTNTITVTLNQIITVTVNPSSLTQTICSGDSTDIILSSNITNTVFSWTATLTSGSGTTFNASGTGSPISEIIYNISSLPSTVTYHIVATASPCTNSSTAVVVTINPAPLVDNQTGTVCSDVASGISLGASTNGLPVASYSITSINSNGLTSSAGSPITGTGFSNTVIADDAWTNTMLNPVDVVYTISPVATNGCSGTPFTVTLTVNPEPVITNPSTQEICSGSGTNITLGATIPSTYTWTVGTINGGITGASAGSGATLNQLLTNPSGVNDGTVQYLITPRSTTGLCFGNAYTITVTVHPKPVITNSSKESVCSEAGFFLPLTSSTPSTFAWTIGTITGGITGAVAGSGDTISHMLINPSSTVAGTVQYSVTPTTANWNCPGDPFTITVTVNPKPTVTASSSVTGVCPAVNFNLSSSSTINLPPTVFSENFNGASNSWTRTNTSSGGTPANAAWTLRPDGYVTNGLTFRSNDVSQFYLSDSRSQNGTITATTLVSPVISTVGYSDLSLSFYHFYDFNSTSGESAKVEVSTNSGSTWTSVATYTSDRGGASSFQNVVINLGSTYINSTGFQIRFNYYCGSNRGRYWAIDNVTLTGTPAITPNIAWTSNPAGFTSSVANPANVSQTTTTTYVVQYTHPTTSCSNTASVTVNTYPAPTPAISADYCSVPGYIRLTASGGGTYLWSTGQTTQTIDVDIVGVYSVIVTNANGCSASAFITVATELVTDGTFTNFNPASPPFFTTYVQNQNYYTGVPTSGLWPEGYYAVNTSAWSNYPNPPQGYHTNFHGRDHTNNAAGPRNFMMINGSITAGQTIWQQTVAVQPNTNYYFSAWGMNLNPASPARLQFEINGLTVGTIADLNIAPKPTTEAQVDLTNWVRFYSNPHWNSGAATTAVIRIVNLNTVAGGNDFGLDDISFGTLAPIPFTIDPSCSDTVCAGQTVNLYTNITGGKPPISYSWTGPNGFTSTQQDPVLMNASAAASGWYRISVTDGYGCSPTVDSVAVTVNPLPDATVTGTASVCVYAPSPDIIFTGSSATAPYTFTYNINGGANLVISTVAGNTVSVGVPTSVPGTYIYNLVSVSSANGCSRSLNSSFSVTVHPLPTCIITGNNPVCPGSAGNIFSGEPGMSSYSWSIGGNGTIAGPANGINVTVLAGDTCGNPFYLTLQSADSNGCVATCQEDILADDIITPIISCPSSVNVNSDPGQNYATLTIPALAVSDNCTAPGSLIIQWTMTTPTAGSGNGMIPDPFQFNVGTTTITYTVTDNCGNTSTCSFTVQVNPNSPPDMDCQPDIVTNTDPGLCSASLDPGIPTINSGTGITLHWSMTGATAGSGTGAITPVPYTFNAGLTVIRWVASNVSGTDTCFQTITVIDNEPPDFTPPQPQTYCVIDLQDALYFDPTMDITPDRPEYYILSDTDKANLSPNPALFIDNCSSASEMTLYWRIDFNGGDPAPITGTGPLSDYTGELRFAGDVTNNVVHTITYWLIDAAGNSSLDKTVTITITPRPNIIKQ